MNDVWLGLTQHFGQIAKIPLNRKPFIQLLCHQRFPITGRDDLASLDPADLGSMRFCNLPTSYDGNFKHDFLASGTLRNDASIPPPWALVASNPTELSVFHCCNESSARQPAIL